MAHDVFVSHSSKDKPTADAVVAILESQGIRCWVAPRDVIPGKNWGACIIDAIKGARVMVLVFSANANSSAQISREVERSVNKGIPVIPLRIEDVVPTDALEYFLSSPHWLDDFTPPLDKHLQYLTQIVRQIIASPSPAEAPPAPEPAVQEIAAAPQRPRPDPKPEPEPNREQVKAPETVQPNVPSQASLPPPLPAMEKIHPTGPKPAAPERNAGTGANANRPSRSKIAILPMAILITMGLGIAGWYLGSEIFGNKSPQAAAPPTPAAPVRPTANVQAEAAPPATIRQTAEAPPPQKENAETAQPVPAKPENPPVETSVLPASPPDNNAVAQLPPGTFTVNGARKTESEILEQLVGTYQPSITNDYVPDFIEKPEGNLTISGTSLATLQFTGNFVVDELIYRQREGLDAILGSSTSLFFYCKGSVNSAECTLQVVGRNHTLLAAVCTLHGTFFTKGFDKSRHTATTATARLDFGYDPAKLTLVIPVDDNTSQTETCFFTRAQ